MSFKVKQPVKAIVTSSSFFKMFMTCSTPSCPLTVSPYKAGLPMKTIEAPKASALKTSVPCLTPPSKNIGIFPLITLAISGSASI